MTSQQANIRYAIYYVIGLLTFTIGVSIIAVTYLQLLYNTLSDSPIPLFAALQTGIAWLYANIFFVRWLWSYVPNIKENGALAVIYSPVGLVGISLPFISSIFFANARRLRQAVMEVKFLTQLKSTDQDVSISQKINAGNSEEQIQRIVDNNQDRPIKAVVLSVSIFASAALIGVFLTNSLGNGMSHDVSVVLFGAIINIILSYFIERRFHQNIYIVSVFTILVSITATTISFYYLSEPSNHLPITIIAIFMASVLLWAASFHLLAANFGMYLGAVNLGRFSILSKNWVKAVDYVYLTLSTLSILRIVVGAAVTGEGVVYFNAMAAVVLGLSVALRITRTSVEIFGWDKSVDARS